MTEYKWVGDFSSGGSGGSGSPYWIDPVDTASSLPASAPEGTMVLVKDEDALYQRESGVWVLFVDPGAISDRITDDEADLAAHIANTSNPHSVTKTQVGLGNVDNTSDVNKPVSTAQAAAIALKVSKSGDTMSGELAMTVNQGGGSSTVNVFDAILHKLDTGVYEGGIISITSGDPFKFDVSAGYGDIIDMTDPTYPLYTRVTWAAKLANTITNIGSSNVTYVGIDSSGNLVQQTTKPTNAQRRDTIWLGRFGHNNMTGIPVGGTINDPNMLLAQGNQLRDLMEAIGYINLSGNVISANGANLQLNKTAGVLMVPGASAETDPKDPNKNTLSALTALTFAYSTQTGTLNPLQTAINPAVYDNAGTVTSIPGSSNKATNLRVYLAPANNIFILYGQQVYSTLSAAVAAVQSDSWVVPQLVKDVSLLIGTISVIKGATALNNPAQAVFTIADKFGSSGASGTSTSTLQQAYNNGSNGDMVVDSTRLGVAVRDAATALTAGTDLFSVTNNAGSTKYLEVDSQGVKTSNLAASRIAKADANGAIASGSVDLTSSNDVTGALGIANGGTGQTTAANAINALLPSQSGNSGKFLTTNGSAASWGVGTTPAASGSAAGTVSYESSGSFTVYLKNAAGASLTSGTANWYRVGKMVSIALPTLESTTTVSALTLSDSATSSVNTWPAALTPTTSTQYIFIPSREGATSTFQMGRATLTTAGVLTLKRDLAGSDYTASSASKGLGSPYTISYMVD